MDAIITSLPEKLPEEVRALIDEARPLPPGVVFFEERFTGNGLAMVKRAFWSVLALLGGIVLVPFSLYAIFSPGNNTTVYDNHGVDWWLLGFGGVLILAGWSLVASIPAIVALGRRQQAGARTRYGIFLLPEALVWHGYFDTTVIPHGSYRGLADRKVRYVTKKPTGVVSTNVAPGTPLPPVAATDSLVERTFTLPEKWIGTDAAAIEQSIHAWHPAQTPPMLSPTNG